ncbi:MAG: hypothetical protein WBE63_07745, partial [Acidobacteriaceae bacterium]
GQQLRIRAAENTRLKKVSPPRRKMAIRPARPDICSYGWVWRFACRADSFFRPGARRYFNPGAE